jgi:hypothetical protein
MKHKSVRIIERWIYIACVLVVVAALAGCARISFRDGEGSYWRIGPQKIVNLKVVMPDGTTIEVGKQESNAGETLKNTSEAVLNMTKKMGGL